MAKNTFEFNPDYAVPPGSTLRESMEERGMSQEELGRRTGLSRKTINEILSGKAAITPDTANRLAMATTIPCRIWNTLERNYREKLAELAHRQKLAKKYEWAKQFPCSELAKRGHIRATSNQGEIVEEVFRFFEVSDDEAWERVHGSGGKVLYRKGKGVSDKPFLTATWLQIARLEARSLQVQPFDSAKFKAALHEIRKLTQEPDGNFENKLIKLSGAAGVAVVLVREFKGAAINGAMFWEGDKPIIALTTRGKTWDKFWFNFFHEAMHALYHGKKHVFLDLPRSDGEQTEIEEEADRRAAELLIPESFDPIISELKSEDALVAMAAKLCIHPCIIVGRYHRLTKRYTQWHHLIVKLDWAE